MKLCNFITVKLNNIFKFSITKKLRLLVNTKLILRFSARKSSFYSVVRQILLHQFKIKDITIYVLFLIVNK